MGPHVALGRRRFVLSYDVHNKDCPPSHSRRYPSADSGYRGQSGRVSPVTEPTGISPGTGVRVNFYNALIGDGPDEFTLAAEARFRTTPPSSAQARAFHPGR